MNNVSLLELRLCLVAETLKLLNLAEDYANDVLVAHNRAVRDYNYLLFLSCWVSGKL